MIELKNLGKTFTTKDQEIVALKNIDLTIQDGEIFGIIGLSGAGKSTLVRCINLLERPTEGDVLIDGQSLTKMPRRELLEVRRNIGMIFQGFNLLEQRNVLRNVCYPLEIARVPRAQAEARARELLKVVGLEDREKAYPAQLSGGQKQRVAIARALATNPKYLLCDEATSALDPNTTRAILELLREINRSMGVTIVVITHEMKVIDTICDRVAIIDHSRIAEVGKVSDVFSSPRSDIARELILPMASAAATTACGRRLRIVFDGTSSQKPLISNMIMTCQVAVSILFADIKDVNGASYGHMIIELPDDDRAELKVISWIMNNGLKYTREA